MNLRQEITKLAQGKRKTKTVSIYLEQEDYKLLQGLAKFKGLSLNKLGGLAIRALLTECLNLKTRKSTSLPKSS